jgi:hypothetical protein
VTVATDRLDERQTSDSVAFAGDMETETRETPRAFSDFVLASLTDFAFFLLVTTFTLMVSFFPFVVVTVMVVAPAFFPRTSPVLPTVAMADLEDRQDLILSPAATNRP